MWKALFGMVRSLVPVASQVGPTDLKVYHPHRRKRTWYDTFIDLLDRTLRPAGMVSILLMFAWSVKDPVQFALWAEAVAKIPDNLWTIILLFVTITWGLKDSLSGIIGTRTIGSTTSTSINGTVDLNKLEDQAVAVIKGASTK